MTDWHRAGLTARKWIGLLLAGNPFYIASAALLLFGINRLSTDSRFLSNETANLLFSFSALQVYELLLIGVALFLAARRIFYDSALLVVIENIVLMVPFILVTQAVFIGRGLALVLCAFGAGLVVVRFSALKNWFSELSLPGRFLLSLGLLLLVNSATPLLFRQTIDAHSSDGWEKPYQYGWFFVLPSLQLMALFLPGPARNPNPASKRPWLPFLFHTLWIAGTAVHLWCMGYVSDREFRFYLLAPLLWASAWMLFHRLPDFVPHEQTLTTLVGAPVVAVLPAAGAPDLRLFVLLTLGNAAIFGLLAVRRRHSKFVQWAIASVAVALAALPAQWGAWIPELSRVKCLEMGIGAFVLSNALIRRQPAVGACGALLTTLGLRQFWPALSAHLCLEVGLVFLLVHSLSWEAGRGERFRIVTAATWIVHAFGWTYADGTLSGWTVSSAAVIVLICYLVVLYTLDVAKSRLIPISAAIVLAAPPANIVVRFVQSSPPGVVAMGCSFILLAAGTWLALARKSNPPQTIS